MAAVKGKRPTISGAPWRSPRSPHQASQSSTKALGAHILTQAVDINALEKPDSFLDDGTTKWARQGLVDVNSLIYVSRIGCEWFALEGSRISPRLCRLAEKLTLADPSFLG